jgi:hypothetical protein
MPNAVYWRDENRKCDKFVEELANEGRNSLETHSRPFLGGNSRKLGKLENWSDGHHGCISTRATVVPSMVSKILDGPARGYGSRSGAIEPWRRQRAAALMIQGLIFQKRYVAFRQLRIDLSTWGYCRRCAEPPGDLVAASLWAVWLVQVTILSLNYEV